MIQANTKIKGKKPPHKVKAVKAKEEDKPPTPVKTYKVLIIRLFSLISAFTGE